MLTAQTLIHNRYRVVRHLAGGGMGHIYEAIDERFQSTVALKQMSLSGVTAQRAFQREARMLNHLRHSALPRVTDYFDDDLGHFLVMDFIPGKDLSDLLAEQGQPFAVHEVLTWIDELLDVLIYLHSQDVIHRDIKPQNLKLSPDNRLIVLDFGIAKNQTGSRSIQAFTPQFAPLEQIQGEGTDLRSDLYSVAATAYALLTNEQPHSSMTRFMEVARQSPDPLRPLHEANPQVPYAVSMVLMQALALRAADRPAHAAMMRDMLQQAIQQPDSAPTIVPPSPATVPLTQAIATGHNQTQHVSPRTAPPQPPTVATAPPVAASSTTPPTSPTTQRPAWLLPALGGGFLVLLLILAGAGLAHSFIGGFTGERDTSAQPTSAAESGNRPAPTPAAGIPLAGDIDDQSSTEPPAESATEPPAEPATSAPVADTSMQQTAQSLNATATAVAHMEQTAQARAAAEERARTSTALRETEQAIAATSEALAEAQTAQAAPLAAPTAPPPAAANNVCDQATVIGSIAELAIQESPFIDNTVLMGTAPRGARVDVLCVEPQTSDGRVWAWIRYQGIEGWMSTRYMRFDQGMPVGQCSTGTVVEVSALSIREETNRESRYLGEVPGGTQVAVLCVPQIAADGRSWAFVHYQGIEGWMSTRYLNIR
jgi:serine/threonine protein kinase